MARALATTTLLVCGCTQQARPAPPPPPAPAAPAAVAPAPPALELTPAPAFEPAQLSILEPAAGQRLEPSDANSAPITVHSARPDWVVELALDGRRSRPLSSLPEKPVLGDLSEGAELEPGPHYLVVTLRAAEHEPGRFAVTRFAVGSDVKDAGPLVFCTRPSGTYYGPSGAPLLLDFVTHGFEPGVDGAVRVRALGREALLRDARPRLVHGFTPGDWRVELELLGRDGEPLAAPRARHHCELTLNEVAAP